MDINNDVGFSVNNNNFAMLHARSQGVFTSGGRSTKGYVVRGYGHHFSDIYAGGIQTRAALPLRRTSLCSTVS